MDAQMPRYSDSWIASQLPAACPKTNTKISEERQGPAVPIRSALFRRTDGRTDRLDGLLPVIESNEAALVLASYGRYRTGDASSGITLFIFVN